MVALISCQQATPTLITHAHKLKSVLEYKRQLECLGEGGLMSQILQIQGRFGYGHVTLDKKESNSLGIGSYGAVYRAKCGQLPCAAKILHPILFSTRDPASQRIVQRFRQECQILSEMRHPNIIQYLGTCADLDTGLPVLFMELMDENLTSFLERSTTISVPVPFTVQVDIGCNVAQALAYLHSHDIIHRDLSSNNVLLIGPRRAKVTDFGMSRLTGVERSLVTPFQLTNIPGTEVYMPPEAFREPPEYSDKLDCFSMGVLGVQLMTREFPNPGPRRTSVEVPRSELFPSGRAERLISEVDRRREHIDTVPGGEGGPQLAIYLRCLKDEDGERPSAEELCIELAALKESPLYQNPEPPPTTTTEQKDGATVKSLEEQLQRSLDRGVASDIHFEELQKDIMEKTEALQVLELRLEEQDMLIRTREVELREKARTIRELQGMEWESAPDTPSPTYGESTAIIQDKAYFCDGLSETCIFEYDSNTKAWSVIECSKKYFSIAVINGLLTAVGGENQSGRTLLSRKMQGSWFGFSQRMTWVEELPRMQHCHKNPAIATTTTALIVVNGWSMDRGTTEVLDMEQLQWSTVASCAQPISFPSSAVVGDYLYVGGRFSAGRPTQLVFRCNIRKLLGTQTGGDRETDIWSSVAQLPAHFSTLVMYQDQLLAMGGQWNGRPTTTVYRYVSSSNTWKAFGHMNVARFRCMAAVLPGDRMMVVGGDDTKTSVEIGSYQN